MNHRRIQGGNGAMTTPKGSETMIRLFSGFIAWEESNHRFRTFVSFNIICLCRCMERIDFFGLIWPLPKRRLAPSKTFRLIRPWYEYVAKQITFAFLSMKQWNTDQDVMWPFGWATFRLLIQQHSFLPQQNTDTACSPLILQIIVLDS